MRISTDTKKVTFQIPNDPDGGEVEIKHLDDDVVADLVAGFEVVMSEGASGGIERVVRSKSARGDERYAVNVAAIVGWKGISLDEKKEASCTAKNKILFLRKGEIETESGEVIKAEEWVTRCRVKLAEDVKAAREEERKNLKG